MKNPSVIVIVLGVAAVAAAGVMLSRRGADAPLPAPEATAHGAPVVAPTAPAPTPAAPAPVGVDELMKNVDKHRGELIVEGIVSAAAQGRISLIDCGELEKCGVVTCAELTLPVEWAGASPAVKQRVRLHGKVRESGGKLSFVADRLEAVPAPAPEEAPGKGAGK